MGSKFDDLSPELKEKLRACETAEELEALAAKENVELSLDELEGAAGGRAWKCPSRWHRYPEPPQPENPQPAKPDVVKFCVDCGATYMESQGHDCPEQ